MTAFSSSKLITAVSRINKMINSFVNLFQDLEEQEKMTDEQLAIKNVGKQDPKRHLGETVNEMLADNIVQNLASMLDTASFQ